jgi:exodeoxyribonuclease X
MTPEYVFIDTETTTAKPDRQPVEVIELAYITDDGSVFSQRYCPEYPPSWGAMATHGITMQDLVGKPPTGDALLDAPTDFPFWIGHNIDFDWRALGSPEGPRRICTLALSRSLFPDLDSHTLSVMYLFAKGLTAASWGEIRQAHGALQDCNLLVEVWLMLCAKAGRHPSDIEGMWELSEDARVPRTMTFGKFAGQPISAVDRGYANWYRRQPDPDPYLLEAFRRHRLI